MCLDLITCSVILRAHVVVMYITTKYFQSAGMAVYSPCLSLHSTQYVDGIYVDQAGHGYPSTLYGRSEGRSRKDSGKTGHLKNEKERWEGEIGRRDRIIIIG